MKFSPTLIFWLTFAATVLQGISSGTVHLSGLVPAEYLPMVTGWIGLTTFVMMTFLTVATGAVGPGTGPLARAPTVEEAQKVMDQAKGAGK